MSHYTTRVNDHEFTYLRKFYEGYPDLFYDELVKIDGIDADKYFA